jgi:hypothetical protein
LPNDHTTAPARGNRDIPVIRKNAVYTLESARAALGLAKGCLPREIRLGRLRVAKRAGKYLITGCWLMEWIQGGEVTRHRHKAAAECNGTTDGEAGGQFGTEG